MPLQIGGKFGRTRAVPTVLVLQHAPCETLGIIADALATAGISPQHVLTFRGQPVPGGMGDAAGLIVMGGPMGVYERERFPFLEDEMRLIDQALREEKAILGVCLGSQLLAASLGAAVARGKEKEIGWHPVTLTHAGQEDNLLAGAERTFTAFQWHGDVFELPRGAVSLASSSLTRCQTFRYGLNAYGFLFHMEVTQRMVQEMVASFPEDLLEARVSGSDVVAKVGEYLPRLHRIGRGVFERWATLALRA